MIIVAALALAAAIGILWPDRRASAQFIDRIVRPCVTGNVTLSTVIVNSGGTGNVDVVPCQGNSLTVNGVAVGAGGPTGSGANGQVTLWNGASTVTGIAGITWTAPGTLSLGVNTTSAGKLILFGATSGSATIGVPAVAGTPTFNFPTTTGANTNALITDGSGNASWVAGNVTIATTAPVTGGQTVNLGGGMTIACATCTTSSAALTANAFLFGAGSQGITATAAATNGQVLIGSTAANPVAATLTAGSGITITNGAGSITVAATGGGTVTSFSSGNLSPLFTTSVATPTTTPALAFTLNTQSANQIFGGPSSGAAATPTFRALVAADVPAVQLASGNNITMSVANEGVTGTTLNKLAKLTGAPSTAIITALTDTVNAMGIVVSGAGTTGSANIAIIGQASCVFDGATTANDYFGISTTVTGDCTDLGAAFPNGVATYGRVLTTNAAGGTFVVELMTPDIAFQNAGSGKSKPGGSNTQLQYNNSGVFGGTVGVTFTATGQLTFALGTITVSTPFITTTGTFNAGGVTFNNAFSNITDTASANGSSMFDWQHSGTSALSLKKGTGSGASGVWQLLFENGTATVPTIASSANTNTGILFNDVAANYVTVTTNGSVAARFASDQSFTVAGTNGIILTQGSAPFRWSASTRLLTNNNGNLQVEGNSGNQGVNLILGDATANSAAVKRSTTTLQARLGDDSGPTGWQANKVVTAKTSNYTVVTSDTETVFTNTGAAGEVDFTLPTAAKGLTYTFYVDAAQTIKVIAGASTTIRIAGSVSAAAGNITNATTGGAITLVAISTTQWVALSGEGAWTVT